MKGFIEDTIFIVVEMILIVVFAVMVVRAVGSVFNPDKEVVTLNTELLRAKINEACQFPGRAVKLDKFNLPQPKPSRILGITDFLPTYAISGSGAADPHYILYYEAFPPGEAIGWEAYLRQDTRYIAPFDYAKYRDTDKLKNKGASITGNDVVDFFNAAKAYEQDVLKQAEHFSTQEVSESGTVIHIVSYTIDDVPKEPEWKKLEPNPGFGMARSTVEINQGFRKGKLQIITQDPNAVVFKHSEPAPSQTSILEVEVEVKQSRKSSGFLGLGSTDAEKIFISIRNEPFRADLIFRKDKIILDAKTKKEHEMSTTDRSHKYKLEMTSGKVTVSVDDIVVSELSEDAKTGTENAYLWGAGNPDDPTNKIDGNTESFWSYVNYGGDKVQVSETAEEKSALAKKPVLINNIILNDYLNVIPTEKPKPPGHGVTAATSDLGNLGQWVGDRFEFSDYFGLTKEERAYIKYEPCGANALCLKTRDAVQRFPLDNVCKNVKYIQMDYDARGLELEDLVPAAKIAGELALRKALSKAEAKLGEKAVAAAPSALETINTDVLFKGFSSGAIGDVEVEVAKKGFLSKAIGKLGTYGKGITKSLGKKSLGKLLGKTAGPLKFLLIADIIFHQAPDLAKNVMAATLRFKNSEFYIASPCKLNGDEMTIKYVNNCQDDGSDDKLCSEGITYPLYGYRVDYDGTKTITHTGDHFMCLESIGKDKDEPQDYKDKYKEEIKQDKTKENIACIKIEMKDVKRDDFCWTNNPVFPKQGFLDRLKDLVPGKTEALDAIVGCGIGALATIWTGPGAIAGCITGSVTSISIDEGGKIGADIWAALGNNDKYGSLKEQLFVRLGGLPVTEDTAYITDDKKHIEAVEMGPTDIIGGNAAKRFGEVAKDIFEIHWAWPR